jgi:hypothetical protein
MEDHPVKTCLLILLFLVVLTPHGTFVCEHGKRQCDVGPDGLVGLFSLSAFAQGYGGQADYFLGALYVFREATHGLEWVDMFSRCPRIIKGFYQCGTPKPGSVIP